MNTVIPPITPSAPHHAGKREANFFFENQHRISTKVTPVRAGFSTPMPKTKMVQEIIPLPKNLPIRSPDLTPFEAKELKSQIRNLNDPESIKLRFAIFFFILSLIFLSLFLLEIHPEIFLLLSIVFFSFSIYPFAKYIKKLKNKNKLNEEEKKRQNTKESKSRFSKIGGLKPSERFSMIYGNINQHKVITSNIETSVNLFPPFVNADRSSASIPKVSNVVMSIEAQTDALASETLKKLEKYGLKPLEFSQYSANLKNFIVKNIISKINLTSDKPYVDMMLTIPGFDRDFVTRRIRELAGSTYLAGHLADKGDNQIVLHILSVWLSYLMTNSKDDKQPKLVFEEKHLITNGKEPKIESPNDIYFIANSQYNSFYVISKSLEDKNTNVERFYGSPGKDSMYSALTLFFFIVKHKLDFILDAADLKNQFNMNSIFEISHRI